MTTLVPVNINLLSHTTERAILISINEFLTIAPNKYTPRPKLIFITKKGTECQISIQASDTHYSEPREITTEYGAYSEVEVGYPTWEFSKECIKNHADDPSSPMDTIYPYIPLTTVVSEIFRALNEI